MFVILAITPGLCPWLCLWLLPAILWTPVHGTNCHSQNTIDLSAEERALAEKRSGDLRHRARLPRVRQAFPIP